MTPLLIPPPPPPPDGPGNEAVDFFLVEEMNSFPPPMVSIPTIT